LQRNAGRIIFRSHHGKDRCRVCAPGSGNPLQVKMNPHTRAFLIFVFARAAPVVIAELGVMVAAGNCPRLLRNLVQAGPE
jgi:hypothetical protein